MGKMPGDRWQKFAGVRSFYAYTMAHPGKKLSFMGVELGTEAEWASHKGLDWHLLENEDNQKLNRFIKDMNRFYHENPQMWEIDFNWEGFEWLVPDDNHNNVVVFVRKDKAGKELVCAINFSPNAYEDYRFGCPAVKEYVEVFNSDRTEYGGSGVTNDTPCPVSWTPSHDKESSVSVRIPPLGAVFLVGQGKLRAKPKPRKKAAADDEGKSEKAPAKKKTAAKKSDEKKTTEKKAAEKKTAEKKTTAKKTTAKKKEETPAEKAAFLLKMEPTARLAPAVSDEIAAKITAAKEIEKKSATAATKSTTGKKTTSRSKKV